MIHLEKSNFDQDVPTVTEPIHIVDNQDNQPLAEILCLLHNKQKQMGCFVEENPVDTISSSKYLLSFQICDEADNFLKRTLCPFPSCSRLPYYLPKIVKKGLLDKN